MMGWPSMASRATHHGIPFASYPSLPPWPEGVPLEHDNFSLMDRMVHGPEAAADIVEVAKDFGPDVIVIDCMMGGGFRAAASVGVATCVLCHVLYNPSLTSGATAPSKVTPSPCSPRSTLCWYWCHRAWKIPASSRPRRSTSGPSAIPTVLLLSPWRPGTSLIWWRMVHRGFS